MSPPSSRISRKAETSAPRRLVVSFHDLHPGSREACARFLGGLRALGVPRISLLVVPRWHGGAPFVEDHGFVEWLHERADEGHDLCLHGFFHRVESVAGGPLQQLIGRHYTQSEGEFFQIDAATAHDRLRRGLAIFAAAGVRAHGFTAPAWLLSDEGRTALVDLGFQYTTTFAQVDLLQAGGVVRAPTVVWSCRSAWRRLVSRGWVRFWGRLQRRAPVLRIAAHPGDFREPRLEASLMRQVRLALESGRVPMTYRDLLPPDAPPAPMDSLAAA